MTTDNFQKNKGSTDSPVPEKYHTHNVLGSGGMKIVMRSEDVFAGREVAMAIAKNSSGESQKRFLEEARITASLEHPNIVPVHEIGLSASGLPYFTMKMIHGKTLMAILEELQTGKKEILEKYNTTFLLNVFLKVCDAISFAHSKGILHLDLKPDNIRVGEFGEVLVLDWGLARRADQVKNDPAGKNLPFRKRGGIIKTMDGVIKGTPEYMAPEQAMGKNNLRGPWTDIYALGALLYSMLTYHAPFEHDDPDMVVRAAAKNRFLPPHVRQEFDVKISPALECIVYKAMSRAPSRRYRTVAELKLDVEQYMNGFATVAENASFYTQALLWFKRKRTKVYLWITTILFALFFFFFLGVLAYLKKMEHETFYIPVRTDKSSERLAEKIRMESSRNWVVRFADNFSDPYAGNRWQCERLEKKGDVPVSPGTTDSVGFGPGGALLRAENTQLKLSFSEPLPGGTDVAMQADAFLKDFPPDSSFSMRINIAGFGSGYLFTVRSGLNPYLSIQGPDGTLIGSSQIRFDAGKNNIFRAACVADTGRVLLEFEINGEKVYACRDESGKTIYAKNTSYSFEVSGTELRLREMRFLALAMPIKSDILDLAESLLRKGNYDAAEDLFREAETASFADPDRRQRAESGLREVALLREFQEKASRWHAHLTKHWGGDLQLRLGPAGFIVSVSGGGTKDLSLLKELPVAALEISNAKISHAEELASFPFLKELTLKDCGLENLEFLRGINLEKLNCSGNPLSDLSPLKGMMLRELTASNCRISSVSPLKNMPLVRADLSFNAISSVQDLRCYELEDLDLSWNGILSLHGLASLPLKHLAISGCSLESLEELRGLELETLNCSFNQITSLDPLSGMPLAELSVSNNRISTLEPLAFCPALTTLVCSGNMLDSLDGTHYLSLISAVFSRNAIRNIDCVKKWSGLEFLGISQNLISDLTPLRNAKRLRQLDLSGNPCESLKDLDELSLYTFMCGNTPLSSAGKMVRFPPEQFIFGGKHENKKAMESLHAADLFESPANRKLRRSIRILEAFYRSDAETLRLMSVRIGKKRYTFIPVQLNYESARKAAEQLGADLPMPKDPSARVHLVMQMEFPFWIGMHQDGNKVLFDDGTLYMTFHSPCRIKDFSPACMRYYRKSLPEINLSCCKENLLPLVLEWPEKAKDPVFSEE